jgi:Flp pilus assembly protein TadG
MKARNLSESGQAIVLLAISIVVLLGFTALAIDGGMVFSDRRHAQNAADAAALAGALQKSNGQSDTVVIAAAERSAESNGYTTDQMSVAISPFTDFSGSYTLVTVEITKDTPTSFAHLIYNGPFRNHVVAIARSRVSQPVFPGQAVVAMGNCVGNSMTLVDSNGGGNSGGVRTFEGGIFLNAPESGTCCAMSPPQVGYGISVDPNFGITSVGSCDYAGVGNIFPAPPIETGVNGGARVDDPLASLPYPVCTQPGRIEHGMYQPGNYGGSYMSLGAGGLAPGIYCIDEPNDTKFSGQDVISGEGVVLYFKRGGLSFTGNAYMDISAPTDRKAPTNGNCLGNIGPATDSCTYMGIALFAARNNDSEFNVKGNGDNAIEGMVYALNGTLNTSGGGNAPEEAVVYGQVIVKNVTNNGGGDVSVTYNPSRTYWPRPRISLQR